MKKYLLILILSFYSLKAHSLIEVDITRGNLDPLPIAISPLHVDIKSDQIKDKDSVTVVGERIKRSESLLFKICYQLHIFLLYLEM